MGSRVGKAEGFWLIRVGVAGKGKEKAGVRKTAGMRKDDCVKKIEGDWGGGEKKGSIMGSGEKKRVREKGRKVKGGENGVRRMGRG